MRTLKLLAVVLFLGIPGFAYARLDSSVWSDDAAWYFFVDLERMKTEDAGKGVYTWLEEEVFEEVQEELGIDFGKELDRLTSYSLMGEGPVLIFEGDISQDTKDKVMTFIAAAGDLQPLKSSGKAYYHIAGDEDAGDDPIYGEGKVRIQVQSLEEESWVSLALKNKVVVTSSEVQMKALLANGAKVPSSRRESDTLLILTAEKTLLQAGMNSAAMGDRGESGWESNILRNTQQVAILMAAAADKLAIEAKLVTSEPDMAESLASVIRGLISLMSFDDDMDENAVAMLRGTRVDSDGNTLSVALAIDPETLVSALED